MKFQKDDGGYQRIDPNLTPMIDVCFQLILFFIVNMRLFSPEGDLSIEMSVRPSRAGVSKNADLPTITVRLSADGNGDLAGIRMGQRSLASLKDLQAHVRELVAMSHGSAAAAAEIEIDCDYNLKFEYAMNAMTAISGNATGDESAVPLVGKLRFAPPRKPT